MVSPWRKPTGARLIAFVAPLVVVIAIGMVSAAPALAQTPVPVPPTPPATAADAATQLTQVQHEAEALTEQWHAAQDDLAARQGDLAALQAAVAPAQAAVAAARANEEKYRQQVDAVGMSTFESGNLDQFDALLASGSPQEFLDQMSALETISSQYKDALGALSAEVDKTSAAQADADAAVARAQAGADQATRAEQDLEARKKDAEVRIDQAQQLLDQLSPQQRRDRNGPGEDAPAISGSGVGVDALRAAATQLGKPYAWGATGPGSYDCSGLTSWAFRKVGVTLPRSSSQQATVGKPVAWADLQPGDLVFYYNPVSHVGIYAGDGKFINAPQTGDVVKYQTVSSSAFSGARRL